MFYPVKNSGLNLQATKLLWKQHVAGSANHVVFSKGDMLNYVCDIHQERMRNELLNSVLSRGLH